MIARNGSRSRPKSTEFFAVLLEDMADRVKLAASALRTLSPEQLASELASLEGLVKVEPGNIAARAMLALYRADSQRRVSPETRHDAELAEILQRLEGNTNAPDRDRLRQIGEQIHEAGGTHAIGRLMTRMTEGQQPGKAGLRRHIMLKWWRGLAPPADHISIMDRRTRPTTRMAPSNLGGLTSS